MTGTQIDRRRFLAATGAVIVGAAAAGIAWLAGSNESQTGVAETSPATTAMPPQTSVTNSTAPPPTSTAAPVSTTTTAATVGTVIRVICKQAWGASPVAGEFREHRIEQVTVHHTAVALPSNTEAPGRARQHQSYHQELGWPDLAYHYLIDANGHVYEGRPVTAVGDTATDYDPTGHLLICCEGNFDQQEITARQYDALVAMLAWSVAEFDVSPEEIRGHRDLASTTCPGDNIYSRFDDGSLLGAVADRTAGPPIELELSCGSATEELVAKIETGSA